jgi:phage gp29-like protein
MVTTDYATDELIVWTWRGEAGNPEGMGAFRQAYKPYTYKQTFEEFAAIRIERQACGLPMATGPEIGYDETEEANVHEQLSNLRTAHDAGLVVPSGWTVEFLDLGGADVPFESHIERQHSAMLQTILAQFVGFGSGGDSGNNALSRDSSNFFLMSLEAIADWMCETFNRYAIPQLAGYNGAVDGEKMPKLAHGKVGVRDLDRFTRAIRNVFDSKVILPPEVDAYVREELGLPAATQTTADVPGNPSSDTGSQVNDEDAQPMSSPAAPRKPQPAAPAAAR